MKIALVHDYLVQYGGAERVLESFCELFPRAPVYTLVYNEAMLGDIFKGKEIRTSFLQRVPFSRKEHRLFPILMPMAIEQFDLSHYDVVLSDSSSFAKGIITRPETTHICYCHTPMRYAWDDCHKYTQEFYYPSIIKKVVPFGMNYVRLWDRQAADRVDHFIANSNLVKKRIEKYYQADAQVIYPPVFLENFSPAKEVISKEDSGYYLMVGRLVPYKKFDLGIQVFNQLKLPLKIVGDGPEFKSLEKIAGPTIEFVGGLKSYSKKLVSLYQQAKALIYPQEEDFGLVPLEAMAVGKPVIAFERGGALETVVADKTGIFFKEQTKAALIAAVQKFEKMETNSYFDPLEIRAHAQKFNKDRFKKEIQEFILEKNLRRPKHTT